MDGWDWFWGAFMMLLFWGGLAAVIVFAVRAFGGSGRRADEATDPETILETRFARGDITKDEFEQRRSVLRSKAS